MEKNFKKERKLRMKKVLALLLTFTFVLVLSACTDLEPITTDLTDLEDQIAALETTIEELQTALDAAEADIDQAETDIDAVETDVDAIVVPEFTFDAGTLTVSGTDLTEDLTLPDPAGVEIVWSSSDSSVLTADGHVMRPTATRGDVAVTLTAIIIDGNLVSTKSFDFTVLALDMTDKEKVEAALEAIPAIPDEVTEDLELPTEVGGAQIIWESSNPGVLTADGKVMRPHYDFANEQSVLTGYIVAGKELKLYKKTVTVLKMDYAVHGSLGNPFTVHLQTQAGHRIFVPIENVDKPAYTYNEEFPYIWTSEFGTNIPASINGWGFAISVNADGTVNAYYDGLNGKMKIADGTETVINAQHYAKDQSDSDPACVADVSACPGLPIPADGYVIVFQNTGASNKNNRQFGYTYMRDLEDIIIEGLTTTPSTMQYEVYGGVWWRGTATVWVPKAYINPDVSTFDYDSVLVLGDDANSDGVPDATASTPVIFTNSYNTPAGTAYDDSIDINNNWGIAAEITPETETIQLIGEEGSETEYVLTNPWQISRVYDAIGGSIKTRIGPFLSESTPVSGGDYGSNILLPTNGWVMVFPGTSYGYASDADVWNRRIGADYFYHLENWIFDPMLVEATGIQTPVKGAWE